MDNLQIVMAYYAALDSNDIEAARQYLAENYQMTGFTPHPLDRERMLEMMAHFKDALPNLRHSVSNATMDRNVVRLTVQISGTHSHPLDLRTMGVGVVASSKKFIISPNENYELVMENDRIVQERNISAPSPNRRLSGMLKAMGVNVATIQIH